MFGMNTFAWGWLAAALGVTALLAAGLAADPAFAADGAARFAAGPRDSFYLEIAQEVAEKVPEVEPVDSQGSVENLRRLERGELRFALAQQDVVSEYLRARREMGEESAVRVVGRVFFDYLHIFVRSPLHVERATEFWRYRIWPGALESGTRKTAVRFLESVGVPLSSLHRPPITWQELASCGGVEASGPTGSEMDSVAALTRCFRRDSLDLAMLMVMAGADPACRIMDSGQVTLYPLDHGTLRLLISESDASPFERQLTLTNIPANTYRNQPQAVPTVAVPVLLLARAGEGQTLARRMLRATRSTWDSVAGTLGNAGCRRVEKLPDGGSLRRANLELLRGFEEREDRPAHWPLWLFTTLVGIGLAGAVLWLWRSGFLPEALKLLRRETAAIRILAGLAIGVVLITFFTYLFEHRTNENFSTPWESAWSITIYLFSGLEDRNPYTTGGRLVAAFGLILGPLFFAFLTGWLAGVFIRWEKHMPKNLKGHHLILNWSERAVHIIRQLHHPVILENQGTSVIVVLTDHEGLDLRDVKRAGSGRDEAFEDFYLSLGDPTSERALLNANAQDAQTILILADDRLAEHADERSIRSLFMLRRIATEHQRRHLHIVVELVDDANVPVIEEIAREFPGLVEWVAGLEVRTHLLAQATLNRGVVGFYTDLLRVSDDTNEVYTVPIPDEAAGETFRSYAARFLASEVPLGSNGSANPAMPVGIGRQVDQQWRIFSNPRPDSSGWILERGDKLVLIAYEQP